LLLTVLQVGNHNEKRVSYGHSMIVDPWGLVVAEVKGEGGGEPEIATAEVDLGLIERVRASVPLRRRT